MVKGDFKKLFIPGKDEYNEELANDAWLTLFDEYNEAVNSKSVNVSFELKKQVYITNGEYSFLRTSLFAVIELSRINIINGNDKINIDFFLKTLAEKNYIIKKDNLANDIIRIDKQLKNYETKIKLMLEKINDEDKKTSSWTFDDTLNQVEMFRAIAFDEKTTVKKFTTVLNALIKKGETQPTNG